MILLVAKNDRKLRIEVGYGLEGVLTDALSRRIREETITPLFRQGDFAGGIDAGVDQLIKVIDGEPLPPPDRRWRNSNETGKSLAPLGNSLPFLIFAVIIGSVLLRRIFGRGVGARGDRRRRGRARLAVHAPGWSSACSPASWPSSSRCSAACRAAGITGRVAAAWAVAVFGGWGGGGFGGGGGFRWRRRWLWRRWGRRLRWRRLLGSASMVDAASEQSHHEPRPLLPSRLQHARSDAAPLPRRRRWPRSRPRSRTWSRAIPARSASSWKPRSTSTSCSTDLAPRARALQVFSHTRVWDTEANNGVLIYVLLADRDVEILADRGIASRVPPQEWETICREIEAHYREGRFAQGSVAGIRSVGAASGPSFPG